MFTRPIYSGKAFERVISTDPMIVATIRPNNIQALEKDTSRSGSIESVDVSLTDLRTVIQEVVKKTADGVDLSEAKIIVAGGRGVKSKEGFQPLEELAEVPEPQSGLLAVHVTLIIAITLSKSGRPGKSSPRICTLHAAFPAPFSIWPACQTAR